MAGGGWWRWWTRRWRSVVAAVAPTATRQSAGGSSGHESRAQTVNSGSSLGQMARRLLSQAIALRAPIGTQIGPRAWAEKLNFETGARTRIFDAPGDAFEELVAPLDDDYSKYSLHARISNGDHRRVDERTWQRTPRRQITRNVDVGPEVTGAIVKRFRSDASARRLQVLGRCHAATRLEGRAPKVPGIIWFYPYEYTTRSRLPAFQVQR